MTVYSTRQVAPTPLVSPPPPYHHHPHSRPISQGQLKLLYAGHIVSIAGVVMLACLAMHQDNKLRSLYGQFLLQNRTAELRWQHQRRTLYLAQDAGFLSDDVMNVKQDSNDEYYDDDDDGDDTGTNGDEVGADKSVTQMNPLRRKRRRVDYLQEMLGASLDTPDKAVVKKQKSHDGKDDKSGATMRVRRPYARRYVELPTFFRIPESALIGFCHTAENYCHRTTQKLKGPAGPPGKRGRKGKPGPMGPPGQCDCDSTLINYTHVGDLVPSNHNDRGKPPTPAPAVLEPPRPLDLTKPPGYRIFEAKTGLSIENLSGNKTEPVGPKAEVKESTAQKHNQPHQKRCQIKLAKRVIHANTTIKYGAWMSDPVAQGNRDAQKRWITEHLSGHILFEYANEADLGLPGARETEKYYLDHMYMGTNHIVYNGSFYYHKPRANKIIRFHLASKTYQTIVIPNMSFQGDNFLYPHTNTYAELASDRFGIWVVYRHIKTKLIGVARLGRSTGQLLRKWTLDIKVGSFENTFVACGILYAIESTTAVTSQVNFVYDLMCDRELKSKIHYLPWENPTGLTSMISLDSFNRRLYVYENGQLATLRSRFKCACASRLAKCPKRRRRLRKT